MRATLVILAIGLFAGCTSDREQAIERSAREANVILVGLRPTVEAMLAGDADFDEDAVISACADAEPDLKRLRDIYEHDHDETKAARRVVKTLDTLLIVRRDMCNGDDAYHRDRCAVFCVKYWTRLVIAVERLRVRAAHADVDLASLAP